MIFDQKSAEGLLDQYTHAMADESKKGAYDLFRQDYWWYAWSIRSRCLFHEQHDRVKAVEEIMKLPPIQKKHQVVDCSGGNFHLIGRFLSR